MSRENHKSLHETSKVAQSGDESLWFSSPTRVRSTELLPVDTSVTLAGFPVHLTYPVNSIGGRDDPLRHTSRFGTSKSPNKTIPSVIREWSRGSLGCKQVLENPYSTREDEQVPFSLSTSHTKRSIFSTEEATVILFKGPDGSRCFSPGGSFPFTSTGESVRVVTLLLECPRPRIGPSQTESLRYLPR